MELANKYYRHRYFSYLGKYFIYQLQQQLCFREKRSVKNERFDYYIDIDKNEG